MYYQPVTCHIPLRRKKVRTSMMVRTMSFSGSGLSKPRNQEGLAFPTCHRCGLYRTCSVSSQSVTSDLPRAWPRAGEGGVRSPQLPKPKSKGLAAASVSQVVALWQWTGVGWAGLPRRLWEGVAGARSPALSQGALGGGARDKVAHLTRLRLGAGAHACQPGRACPAAIGGCPRHLFADQRARP